MPNGTDTRIVQMQFDNRQFERNIKTSGKSLEQFKKLLNFDSCEKSLEKFGKAAEQLTFDKMADNLQKLTDKFTGLGTVSELVISQVRHGLESAAASARRFFNSMTIEQVNAGFEKYGKLNKQVQTIMAATARSEEDVYTVLKRLNEYTDQTSYNFVDMAANIGKFTSVGIDLESAEKQMEGIANWAARSGGGIQEASRAMYNLSQAMGVGALTKIDWKSIENAGMATKEFKEQLIQAGLAAGTLVKENGKVMTSKSLGKQVEVTYQNMAETLSKKWANTEAMQKSFMSYYYENIMYDEELEKAIELSNNQIKKFDKIFEESRAITEKNWKELSASNGMDDNAKSAELYAAALEKAAKEEERFGRGNIDLNKRKVVFNSDGTISTERSFSVNVDGKEILLPTVVEGKIVSEDEAIQHYFETGEHLGIFDTIDEATAYADKLHNEQDKYYNDLLKTEALGDKIALTTNEAKEAAIEAGLALGTLTEAGEKNGKKLYKTAEKLGKSVTFTIDEFENGLKGNWLTRDVAKQVWAFDNLAKSAYESAQKCMTFTDVLEAWKDQLSTGWMNSYNKIFGELSESMKLFSNICNKVGEALGNLIDLRNGILDSWAANGGRDNLWSLIVGEVTKDGKAVAYEGAFGFLDVLSDIGDMISTAFWETMKIFADPAAKLNWNESGYKEGWMASLLNGAIESVRNFITVLHEFFNTSVDGSNKTRWEQIQDVVNAIFATFVLAYTVIRDVSDGLAVLFDQEHFGPSIDALLLLFSELGLTVSKAAQDAEDGYGLLYLFELLDETCRPLIKALNELILTIVDVAVEFLKTGRENGDFLAFWESITEGINTVAEVIVKYGTPIVKFLSSLVGVLGRLFQNGINSESLKTAGQELKANLKVMLDTIFSGIPDFSSRAKAFWETIKTWVTNGFQQADWEAVKKKLKSAIKIVLGVLPEGWSEAIIATYNKMKTSFSQFKDKIVEFFKSIWEAFKNSFSEESLKNLAAKAKDLWGSVISAIPEGIKTSVKSAYNSVVTYVSNLWTKLTTFFNGLFGGKKDNPVDKIVEKVLPGDSADKALDDAKNMNIFEKVINWIETSAANLKASFQKLIGNDAGDAGSFGEAIKKMDWGKILVVILGALGGVGIVTVIAKIIGIVKTLANAFDTITDLMKNGIKFVNHGEEKKESIGTTMLKIAGAMALMTASLTVIANLEAKDAWKAIEIIGTLSVAMMLLGAFFKMIYKDVPISDAVSMAISIIAIGIAIGRIVAAIMPLSTVDEKQLDNMMAGLADIILSMVILGFTAKNGNLSFKDTAGVLAFCVGVWLLINALLKIKDLKPEQLIKMGASLVVILGLLLAFAVGLKKLGGSMAGSGMKEAAFLAAAVGILIFALLPLALMRWDQLAKIGVGLVFVLASLMGFVIGTNKLAKGGLSETGMVQLIAVAGSVMMLMLALMPLALMRWDQLAKIGVGLVVVLGSLMGFIIGINKLTQGGLSNTGMVQLIAVAGSVMMLMLALMPLALMRWDQLARMGVGLVVVLGALMGFTIGVNKLTQGGLNGAGMVQLLAVAGAIALVVIALTPLALMDWVQLGKMGAGFVVIMLMFSGIIAASKKLNAKSAIGSMGMMIMLAGLMYVFALSLTMIPSNMDWKVIGAFAVGLAVMIAAMGAALKMASAIRDPGTAIIAIVAIAAGIAAVLGAIALMAPMVIGSIGDSLQRLSAELSLMGGMLGDFIGEMNGISEGDIDATKRKFDKLFMLIAGLKDSSEYLPAIHNFSNCCLLLGSGLHQFVFSTSTIGDPNQNNGILLLEKILSYKDQLVAFTGAREAADQMSLLGSGLSGFNTSTGSVTDPNTPAFQMLDKMLTYGDTFSNLNGAYSAAIQMAFLGAGLSAFSTETSGVTNDNPVALQLLANMANNANNLDTLTKIDLSRFADQMAGLGGGLAIYALGVKEAAGIETGDMPDVSSAIAILTSLTKGLSDEAGQITIPEIPGEKEDFTHFGVQLAALAGGLIEFAKASEGLGDYQEALNVLDFMVLLKERLTLDNLAVTQTFREAGIDSNSELISFGLQIAALGSSLKDYNDSVKNFTKNQAALDVLDFMADLKGKLTMDSIAVVGVFSSAGITNTSTLSDFGNQISALGTSMSQYNTAVGDFKENKDAIKAIDYFFALQTKLLSEDIVANVFSIFTDKKITTSQLSQFGTDIGALGEALAGFAANVNFSKDGTGEVKSDFDNAMKSLDMLQKLSVQLPKYGGITQAWEGATLTLTQLSGDIRSMGEALGQFSDELSTVGKNSGKTYDVELVKGALEAVQVIVQMAGDMTKEDNLGGFTAYNYVSRLTDIMHMLLEVPEFMGGNKQDTFINNVVDFMKRFQDASNAVGGIGDATIFQSFSNLASGIQKMAQTDPAFDFKQIGLNIDAGIKLGIENGSSGVIQAAIDMAVATYKAVCDALDEHSPSRLFMQVGAYVSEGMAIGINKSADQAADASESMAESTVNSAKGILASVSSILANDVDSQPTIRPVLDLSNITAGARTIGGMFGDYGVGLDTSGVISRASRTFTPREVDVIDQNGTDTESMLARMDGMLENIQKMGDSIANMKLVLDTGVLAGGVSDDVDLDIGRKMFYAGRRN